MRKLKGTELRWGTVHFYADAISSYLHGSSTNIDLVFTLRAIVGPWDLCQSGTGSLFCVPRIELWKGIGHFRGLAPAPGGLPRTGLTAMDFEATRGSMYKKLGKDAPERGVLANCLWKRL